MRFLACRRGCSPDFAYAPPIYGLGDAVALMKVTKLTTEQQLVDLLKECYPEPAHQSQD
jgi:hypothetical protein